MDLTNASAIVTGGAGGFGSATVRRLAQKGAKALAVRATRSATSENSVRAKFAEFLLCHVHRSRPSELCCSLTLRLASTAAASTEA